jgi:nucleotide-binding universal stress UspA family protein
MFKSILVGVDGSEHGQKAAKVAGEMARFMKVDLWVVAAYDTIPPIPGEPYLQDSIGSRIEETEKIMEEAVALIGEIPTQIKKEILEGPPADAILRVAETRNVDLIIMGTRGLSRLATIFVGSQSQKVVGHAHCPVLLVR